MICPAAPVQSPSPQQSIAFHYERPGLFVPDFTLTVRADGSATYRASYTPAASPYSPYAAQHTPPKTEATTEATTEVTLTPATTARLFDAVHTTRGFADGCASKAKNIASSGKKTLIYTAAAETASCAYDYTEDKAIAELTGIFEAIAFTLDEGRKLEHEHRYDRLALDSETESLVEAVQNGTALEIPTIAPVLRSVTADPQVLERVRIRAAKLLAQAGATP